MAELISIRHSHPKSIGEVQEELNMAQLNNDIAIYNPAFAANDTDIGLDNLGDSPSDGTATTNDKDLRGTTISYHNIRYTVDTKVNRKKTKLEIVKGIRYVSIAQCKQ